MSATELANWLLSNASHKVGWRDLTDDDYAHMRKVVGFVRRHGAQRPANIHTSRWRYSVMNWGHDPLKEDR